MLKLSFYKNYLYLYYFFINKSIYYNSYLDNFFYFIFRNLRFIIKFSFKLIYLNYKFLVNNNLFNKHNIQLLKPKKQKNKTNISYLYSLYFNIIDISKVNLHFSEDDMFLEKKFLKTLYKIPESFYFLKKRILIKNTKMHGKHFKNKFFLINLNYRNYIKQNNKQRFKLKLFIIRQFVYNKVRRKKYKFLDSSELSFMLKRRISFFRKLNYNINKRKKLSRKLIIRLNRKFDRKLNKKFNKKFNKIYIKKERGRIYLKTNKYLFLKKYFSLLWIINFYKSKFLINIFLRKRYKRLHINTVKKVNKFKNKIKKNNYNYFTLKNALKNFYNVKKLQIKSKYKKSVNFLKYYYSYKLLKKISIYRRLTLIQKSFITSSMFDKKTYLFFYKQKKNFINTENNNTYLLFKNKLVNKDINLKLKKNLKKKMYFSNFSESILRKARESRRAQWSYYFNSKLNRRKYKIFFTSIGKTSHKLWFFEILSFFILQIYCKFFSWNHIHILLKSKMFLINFKEYSDTYLVKHGDIISIPYSLVNGFIAIWHKFNYFKFLRRIKKWSYLNYCKHINKKLLKKKNFPKIFKKLPINIYIYRKNLILDYLLPTAVYLNNTNSYRFNLSSQWEISTVYKLYAWKFVS